MDKHLTHERAAASGNGFVYLFLGIALALAALALFVSRPERADARRRDRADARHAVVPDRALHAAAEPGRAADLFGSYRGTDRVGGLRWANVFYSKDKISVRAHNFNSEKLKVNDQRGNPIEIAAAIVWRVEDTARAKFDVEAFRGLRADPGRGRGAPSSRRATPTTTVDDPLATKPTEVTLRSGADEIGKALRDELQVRFALAGIEVIDAKLTHLAYAPEIAGTMLRRQQAEAVIAARTKIVQGASAWSSSR
jgi:hypothetical protein